MLIRPFALLSWVFRVGGTHSPSDSVSSKPCCWLSLSLEEPAGAHEPTRGEGLECRVIFDPLSLELGAAEFEDLEFGHQCQASRPTSLSPT